MKKLILLFAAISVFANLCAQDIIVLKTGEEIKAKVMEVGLDNVKYKVFENIDGPIYTIQKYQIFMIKYKNGSKDVFMDVLQNGSKLEEKEKNDSLRKGIYLGFHITQGAGTILVKNYKFGFGINAGVDLSLYFNDFVGIKTGFTYLKLPFEIDEFYNDISGNISSLGIPIKFLLTTGEKIGFYFESGLNIYFPISSELEHGNSGSNLNHESVILAEETVLGMNLRLSELMSLNIGLSGHYSLTSNFDNENTNGVLLSNEDTNGLLIGLQIGLLFNLSK